LPIGEMTPMPEMTTRRSLMCSVDWIKFGPAENTL